MAGKTPLYLFYPKATQSTHKWNTTKQKQEQSEKGKSNRTRQKPKPTTNNDMNIDQTAVQTR